MKWFRQQRITAGHRVVPRSGTPRCRVVVVTPRPRHRSGRRAPDREAHGGARSATTNTKLTTVINPATIVTGVNTRAVCSHIDYPTTTAPPGRGPPSPATAPWGGWGNSTPAHADAG